MNNVTTNEKAVSIAMGIVSKTIGFDLVGMRFDEIGPNLKKFIEKATNGRFTTNGASGLDGTLIVSSSM